MKEDVKEYILKDIENPSVYVSTYAEYNNGSLYGAWIDLTTVEDNNEFIQVCKELHSNEVDPEFMFQDYQNFPEALYSECSIDVDKILDWYNLDEQDQDVLTAGLEYYCKSIEDVDDIEEFVEEVREHIAFYSDEDFEAECDLQIEEQVSEPFRYYIDYKKVYTNFANGYTILNGIYFN